jgi:alcohol dehydrogenase (NADP+)
MMKSIIFVTILAVSVTAQGTAPPTPPRGTQVNDIPIMGIGTARIKDNATEVVASAIENGFRHIDCAFMYSNQREVGKGIQEGLKRTGLQRKDLWITSKLGNDRHSRAAFALNETLEQLGLSYLDLFLVHWPQRKVANGSFDHVEVINTFRITLHTTLILPLRLGNLWNL